MVYLLFTLVGVLISGHKMKAGSSGDCLLSRGTAIDNLRSRGNACRQESEALASGRGARQRYASWVAGLARSECRLVQADEMKALVTKHVELVIL